MPETDSQLQRIRILSCPHENRHTRSVGFLDKVYPDGSAGVDLGHDHICVAEKWEEIQPETVATANFPDVQPKRRGRPPKHAKPEVPEPKIATPPRKSARIVTVERLDNDRFNIKYQDGESTIEAEEVSLEEITMIATMLEGMRTAGGAYEEA